MFNEKCEINHQRTSSLKPLPESPENEMAVSGLFFMNINYNAKHNRKNINVPDLNDECFWFEYKATCCTKVWGYYYFKLKYQIRICMFANYLNSINVFSWFKCGCMLAIFNLLNIGVHFVLICFYKNHICTKCSMLFIAEFLNFGYFLNKESTERQKNNIYFFKVPMFDVNWTLFLLQIDDNDIYAVYCK